MPATAGALEQVRLQLKWLHQFQFAGYYAAIEQGYYRDAGLEVTLVEATPDSEPVDAVLRGDAEYGVGASDLLLWRQRGAPVVVLGVVFQHSPLAIAARRAAGIGNLHELVGKRVMLEPHATELLAMLRREGVAGSQLQLRPHGFDTTALVAGRVDAMSVYITDEPYILGTAGVDYALFEPTSAGIDFYGDNLYTTEAELAAHPARVAAFRAASLRGWAYAMAHPEATADLILARYGRRHGREHLLFEARAMRRLIQPDLIEPGYMHRGRWQHIADTYAEFGLMPVGTRVDDAFLYDPDPRQDRSWLYWTALSGFALAGLVAMVALYVGALRNRAEAAAARYRAVYEAAPLAFVQYDAERRVLDWNRRAEVMFGWQREEVLGRDFNGFLVPAEEQARVAEAVRDTLLTGSHRHHRNWNLTRDGERLLCEWINTVIRDPTSQEMRIIALGLDITERVRLEQQLEHQAYFDTLTGLPNRSLLLHRLSDAIELARRHRGALALLFIDLDGFKAINDAHGHLSGDALLGQVGQRLAGLGRASDTCGRLGGDEFGLLLPEAEGIEAAALVAEHCLAVLKEPFDTSAGPQRIGASVGIALYPEHGQDAERLLTAADDAMYRAKRAGGGRWASAQADA